MRLKSPFKDYYDGCLRMDQEPQPLYVRKTRRLPSKYPTVRLETNIPYLNLETFIVGLGTVVQPGIIATKDGLQPTFCYSTDDVRKYLKRWFPKHLDSFDNKPGRKNPWGSWGLKYSVLVDRFFKPEIPWKSISTATMPIWIILGDPPWALGDIKRLLSNPRLDSYDFARISPPYQAFQELRTYLCNQAAPREYIPPISNEDMLESKGFDLKTSFRQDKPGGPARKRRKNRRKGK